ncbi:hypothetical protein TRIUR3_22186 [Triticum urartu]|uniref:Uncharacterized protein n=1 Tax=Triticum urartu TaxID=4572 RepID=M7ZN82_TRIUA|nr:hypothetical protein TRIUR3_22186 [Triticum urartu]
MGSIMELAMEKGGYQTNPGVDHWTVGDGIYGVEIRVSGASPHKQQQEEQRGGAGADGRREDWTPPEFGHGKDAGRSRNAGLLTLSSRPPHLMKQPHVVPSMHIPEYSDFSASAMPPQATSSSSSSLPFYNFLPIGPVHRERAPSERRADVSEGEIDLELKLWKG